jgi:starch phosphorylase
VFDNVSDESHTIIHITAPGRPGLLQLVVSALKDLGLDVAKATVDYENGALLQKFWVETRIQDSKDLENLQKVLLNAVNRPPPVLEKAAKRLPPKLHTKQELLPSESAEFRKRTDIIFGLMDQYLKNDVYSIQKSIIGHVEYTIARSRFRFDDFEAYQVILFGLNAVFVIASQEELKKSNNVYPVQRRQFSLFICKKRKR